VITELLSDGISTLRDARGTAERRMALGLKRRQFVISMIAGAAIMLLSLIVPELLGVSQLTDKALGNDASDLFSGWSILPSILGVTCVVTALVIWRGPYVTNALALLFGGQSISQDATTWIYLTTVSGIVISVAMMLIDVVLGMASGLAPVAVGWISLVVAFLVPILSLAITTQMAQTVLRIGSLRRSLVFVAAWVGCAVLLVTPIWLLIYGLLGGLAS
jgi:hypothetical protein